MRAILATRDAVLPLSGGPASTLPDATLRASLATHDAVPSLSGGPAPTSPILQQTRDVKPPIIQSGGYASAPPLPKFSAKAGLAQTFLPPRRIEEEQPMFEEDFPTDLNRPIGVFPGKPEGQSDRSTE